MDPVLKMHSFDIYTYYIHVYICVCIYMCVCGVCVCVYVWYNSSTFIKHQKCMTSKTHKYIPYFP